MTGKGSRRRLKRITTFMQVCADQSKALKFRRRTVFLNR